MTAAVNEMTLAEYEVTVRLTWSETELQTDVIRRAHGHGWLIAHFRPVKQQRRDGSVRHLTPVQADGAGFPDLVMVRGARMVVVELKAKTKLRPEQEVWIAAFSGVRCAETYIWDTKTRVDEIEGVLA